MRQNIDASETDWEFPCFQSVKKTKLLYSFIGEKGKKVFICERRHTIEKYKKYNEIMELIQQTVEAKRLLPVSKYYYNF